MKKAIIPYQKNLDQLIQIGISIENTQIKMGSLCKQLDKSFYLQAVSDIYNRLSSLMYNHHLETRYHSQQQSQSSSSNFNHEEIKDSLISDRQGLWNDMQDKVIKLLSMTSEEHVFNLNTLQLYDLMNLSNIFIEIGLEFSGGTGEQSLLIYISEVMTQGYLKKFNGVMMAAFQNMVEQEQWERLPVPDNFKLREISDPLSEYPQKVLKDKALSLFSNNKQQLNSSHFTQLAHQNPFARLNLISFRDKPVCTIIRREQQPIISEVSIDDDSECEAINDEHDGVIQIYQSNERGASRLLTASQKQSSQKQMLSQSSLGMVKSTIGKYFEMMSVCPHLAFEIFVKITQAVDLYTFVAFHSFAIEPMFTWLFDDSIFENLTNSDINMSKSTNDLWRYRHMHERYIFQQKYRNLKNFMVRSRTLSEFTLLQLNCDSTDSVYSHQIKKSCTSSAHQALIHIIPNSSIFDEQHSTLKSILAIESVSFIQDCLLTLKPHLKENFNLQQQGYLVQYFNTQSLVLDNLRDFICTQSIIMHPFFQILEQTVANVQFINWALQKKKDDHSGYIDKIIYTISQIKNEWLPSLVLPQLVELRMLEQLGILICSKLLDSISKVKKWNDLGRLSLFQDIDYLKYKFISYGALTSKLEQSFVLLHDFGGIKLDELLKFIKQNGEDKLSYQQVFNGLLSSIDKKGCTTEIKELLMNIEIFYSDFFHTFMISNHTTHSY